MAISIVPYLAVDRGIVGRAFGLLLAIAFPMVFTNTLVGQNGFLTAALIGGTLYLMPVRPVLAGICLGLLSYKPQYGLLFPIVLIAAAQWRVFALPPSRRSCWRSCPGSPSAPTAGRRSSHWMPMFSQAFLSEGTAPWWKLQSHSSRLCAISAAPNSWLGAVQWVLTASRCGHAGADVAQPRASTR